MGHGEDPPQGKPSQHTSGGGAGEGECVCVCVCLGFRHAESTTLLTYVFDFVCSAKQ